VRSNAPVICGRTQGTGSTANNCCGARAESSVCSNACKCSRTQITARAGCVRRGAALRATVVLRAACDVRPWCCMLRATVVLLAAWVRSNAPSAVECTMAGSSL
jgi:hypothetical protein